jgi:hypothetical protein
VTVGKAVRAAGIVRLDRFQVKGIRFTVEHAA